MASTYTKSLIKTFAAQYGEQIIDSITDTGLFFPAIVAQLSVESTNGTSDLATRLNNFGSIKGNASNGVRYDTVEGNARTASQAYFKKYDNFKQFIKEYVDLLTGERYADALQAASPEDQVTAWVNDGYSTMSAKAYLANGIKDRINATRELFPGLSRISSSVTTPQNFDIMNLTNATTAVDNSSSDNTDNQTA